MIIVINNDKSIIYKYLTRLFDIEVKNFEGVMNIIKYASLTKTKDDY